MEPSPPYLVRPQGLHLVLAQLIQFVVNKRVPAGTVHVGGLPDAEVTGREAADGRPWNRNTAWEQPGAGAEEWGPRDHPAESLPGVASTALPISVSGRHFLRPRPQFLGAARPSHHRSVWLRPAHVTGL